MARARRGPVTVEGAAELRRALAHMERDADHMVETDRKAGDVVASRARQLAPKVSGRLAGSIRVDPEPHGALIDAGGPAVPYAGPIHFGWHARNIEPNPFLTRAHEQTADDVAGIYDERIDELVRRVGRETP